MRTLGAVGTVALNLLGELIAPTRCAACDVVVRSNVLFCSPCASTVVRVEAAARIDAEWAAAFEYGGAIATAILRLKYGDGADLASRLGRSMQLAAKAFHGAVDLVVPVPLHPRRLAERGYNQSMLIAAPVARWLGVRSEPRALVRLRDTPHQVAMGREHRVLNVAGAFAARGRTRLAGSRVLLVDDVRTTGATLAGCAAALREAGARDVRALVLARRA